jgi:hypothetical protein
MQLKLDFKKMSKEDKEILYARVPKETMQYIRVLAKKEGYERNIGKFLEVFFREVKIQNS